MPIQVNHYRSHRTLAYIQLWLMVLCETKRNETVLWETVLCETVTTQCFITPYLEYLEFHWKLKICKDKPGANFLVTGLPVRPSHKMAFRSSVSKSGLPGEGRHEGLVPRNDVLTNGFIWVSLARSLTRIHVCAPPEKRTRRCEPKEGYLCCSKRFDHGSYSIIFLLFEFKSVRWCWRWETQRNAHVAYKPTRRSR